MTEGCAHCARREAELIERQATIIGMDQSVTSLLNLKMDAIFRAEKAEARIKELEAESDYRRRLVEQRDEKLAAISRQVEALEAEWRNWAKKENLAISRRLRVCADALQTLKELLK